MSNNFLWSNMLCYWQTKYTTLVYRPFFIFPHNRHFFVHISPSVLGVWKFPFCKIPFQPSEDTDAVLSELPPLSHNVGRAADTSQIRKYGSRRVLDEGYRRGMEELPTPSLQLLPMWGERHGGERCHAGWWCFIPDVYCAMHNGAGTVSGHNEQQWWFAQVPGIWPKSTPLHPRRLCPSPSQLMALFLPSFLMENANGAIPYSAVLFQARNGETTFVICLNTEQKIIVFMSISLQQFWGDGFSLTFVVFGH